MEKGYIEEAIRREILEEWFSFLILIGYKKNKDIFG